jgi:hypothetical protein
LPFLETVMIRDTMEPESTYATLWAVGDNRGIFDGNILLIIEAIRDPTSYLLGGKLSAIHVAVKEMPIMISTDTDSL